MDTDSFYLAMSDETKCETKCAAASEHIILCRNRATASEYMCRNRKCAADIFYIEDCMTASKRAAAS